MVNTILIDAIKLASNFAVSSGVSTMVGYAAKSSVPKIAPLIIRNRPMFVSGWKMFHKVAIPAGAAALAGLAADAAVKHTEKTIDEYVALYDKTAAQVETAVQVHKDEREFRDNL